MSRGLGDTIRELGEELLSLASADYDSYLSRSEKIILTEKREIRVQALVDELNQLTLPNAPASPNAPAPGEESHAASPAPHP